MTSSPLSSAVAPGSSEVQSPFPTSTSTTHEEAKPVVLLPKNVHRLNRIFRKPKTMVGKRSWHIPPVEGAAPPRRLGVPYEAVEALVQSLTEEEKVRAKARLDPLSEVQSALEKRAARFGVLPPSSSTEEILKQQQRQSRFGTVQATPAPVQLSEEDRAAMEARARRFGGS